MILGSRTLNFSSLNDAFNITTDSINSIVKTQQDLINKSSFKTIEESPEPLPQKIENNQESDSENNFDLLFLKLVKNPKFEDTIVKYINIFKPDLLKNMCSLEINGITTNSHNNNNNDNIQKIAFNYMVFFVVSVFIYLYLTILFKN